MIRIAKVKFNSGGKLYDYICPDKKIKEGDVVFVEGTDQPLYVYEILEVKPEETKASSKVLGIAKENPNVNLATRFMNIIDCKCECIVNSLGPETDVFGNICRAIVENAHSKEIETMLKENPKAKIFDTFVTDAGNLPSKNVIHIVMPFKHDDKYNKNLKLAFEKVIDLAISKGYESLAIPFVGTGANGYSKNDVHEALDDTMFKYQYKDGIKINIVSINFSTTKMQRYHINEEIMYRNRRYNERRQDRELDGMFMCSDAMMGPGEFYFDIYDEPRNQIQNVNGLISKLYKREDEFDIFDVQRPIDFVTLYRKDKGYKETEKVTYVFGTYEGYKTHDDSKKIPTKYKDTLKNIKNGKHTVTKYEVFRIAIALKLNFTQTIQLMTLFGYSFNPISEENIDYEVFNFMINNNGFAEKECDPEEYFYDVDDVVHDLIFGSNDKIFA